MIDIQIAEPYLTLIQPEWLEDTAEAVYENQKVDPLSDVTLVISGDEEIHALNRQFLGNDAPTDVLSFPADEVDPESGQPYLGDVIISYPRAAEQARQGGHSVQDEIRLLAIHGMLHLLGYDHADDEQRQQMWDVQDDILNSLGSPLKSPPV